MSQGLLEFFHTYRADLGDNIPETDRVEANKQYISIRQLRESLQNAVDKLVPRLEENAEVQRRNDVKTCLDDIDTKITKIKLTYEPWIDKFTEISISINGRDQAVNEEGTVRDERVISPVPLGDRENLTPRISPRLALMEDKSRVRWRKI